MAKSCGLALVAVACTVLGALRPVLIVLVDNIVAVEDRPRFMPANLHAVVLIVAGTARVPHTTSAHIMRDNAIEPDITDRCLKRPSNDLIEFRSAVKDKPAGSLEAVLPNGA